MSPVNSLVLFLQFVGRVSFTTYTPVTTAQCVSVWSTKRTPTKTSGMCTAHIHTDTPTHTCTTQTHRKHQNLRYVYSSHPHWHTHTHVYNSNSQQTPKPQVCVQIASTMTHPQHTPRTHDTPTRQTDRQVCYTPTELQVHAQNTRSQYTLLGITHTRTPKLQLCVQHIYCHMCYTCEMTTVQSRLNLWHIKLCGIKAWYTECRPSTLSETHLHNTYTSSVSLLQTKKLKTCVIFITTASVQYIEYNSIQFNSVYWPIKGPQEATGKLYTDE